MAKSATNGSHPGLRRAAIRRLHLFVGVFIAPSVLFFAVTGSLQLFSLHEAHDGYRPPAVVAALAKVHKDQVLGVEKKAAEEGARPGGPAKPDSDDDGPGAATLALKVFFLAVSLGLVVTTSLGVWMALTGARDRRAALLLLAAGAVVPILLLML